MRVLLDTNVLIHREAASVVRHDIGKVFYWLDKLCYEKCIHPVSTDEIERHKDPKVRLAFRAKLQSYVLLKTTAPMSAAVKEIAVLDRTQNDKNDTALVNELYSGRVDLLISEDRGLQRKAEVLGISDRAYTIDAFLEKVAAENPELLDYRVLAVRKLLFGSDQRLLPFCTSRSKALKSPIQTSLRRSD